MALVEGGLGVLDATGTEGLLHVRMKGQKVASTVAGEIGKGKEAAIEVD